MLPVGRSLLGRVETEPTLTALKSVLRPGTFGLAANPHQKVSVELARLADPRTARLDLYEVLPDEAQWRLLRGDDPKLCAEWTSVASNAFTEPTPTPPTC